MKLVCEKNKCAGCMACVDACPAKAVTVRDEVKCFNAVIDESKCLNCNLCHKICQQKNSPVHREPIYWKQGWSNSEETRKTSSSGGFAYELLKTFVGRGGYVCSCRFDKGLFTFYITNKIDELRSFSGSKYVKSNPVGIYKQIKELLKNGQQVLFVGLPCQVASLINFTNNNPNLFTVDLICHGTPSPKVLESFLKSKKIKLNDVEHIAFRTGDGFMVVPDGARLAGGNGQDYYIIPFIDGDSYTENCYSCEHASINRVSDITIGDSWGSKLPDEMKKNGVSLALCQTEKGRKLLEESDVTLYDVDIDAAKASNPQLVGPSKCTGHRDKLLSGVAKCIGYNSIIRRTYTKRYYRSLFRRVCRKIGLK